MKHAKHLALLSTLIVSSGCWSERSPCELWAGKLTRGEEVGPAIRELQVGACVESRPLLLAHLADPGVEADVLAALVALGRSPEAEAAVKRALSLPATAEAAAGHVVSWSLDAEAELRAALADEALLHQRPALLEAALASRAPERWVGELVRALGDEAGTPGALVDRALVVLAAIDWQASAPELRASAVEALAELATRPLGAVTRERSTAALKALGKAWRPNERPKLPRVVERARGGDRVALLLLGALEHEAVDELALALATRPEIDRTSRWLALSLLRARASRASSESPAGAVLLAAIGRVEADADVMLGLAMTVGPAAAPALAARREAEKGAARVALARAQSAVLKQEELEDWQSALAREASVLLRGLAAEPTVAGFIALTARCGFEASRLSAFVDESAPRLQTLDAELARVRAELAGLRSRVEAETLADSERARVLAQVSGDGLAEARVELAAIRARLEAAYRPVEALTREMETLERLDGEVLLALSRLVGTREGVAAGRTVLERCGGEACARLRSWAVAAIDAKEPSDGEARLALFMRAASP